MIEYLIIGCILVVVSVVIIRKILDYITFARLFHYIVYDADREHDKLLK